MLYIVSTPIGNLDDLSPRAVEVMKLASVVLAEDTRHTRTLTIRFGIGTPLEAYHEHNEAEATPRVVARLLAGDDVALVSDAGTPLLSDPGARLVAAAVEAGVRVVPIPGPSALLAALVVSGLPAERFTFYGFLARKGRERSEALAELNVARHTSVIYEAPNRVAATLEALEEVGAGSRRVAVARELTKQFEEVRHGTVSELARYYADAPPRGEVVLVLEGAPPAALDEDALRAVVRAERDSGSSARDTVRLLMDRHGVPRNLAYRLAQET